MAYLIKLLLKEAEEYLEQRDEGINSETIDEAITWVEEMFILPDDWETCEAFEEALLNKYIIRRAKNG